MEDSLKQKPSGGSHSKDGQQTQAKQGGGTKDKCQKLIGCGKSDLIHSHAPLIRWQQALEEVSSHLPEEKGKREGLPSVCVWVGVCERLLALHVCAFAAELSVRGQAGEMDEAAEVHV